MPSAGYGTVPFAEQVAFFRRKLNLPTNAWTDIWQAEHDHAFVVAGANRDEIVADFRAAIDKALSQGTTLDEFRKDFDAIVAKHGWSYNGGRNWRSRVIYETNLRTSYAAGRYQQLQAIKSRRPYWRYRHSDSVLHPRPMHLAWNNLVLSADDAWWKMHYPPNGWGCQCFVESLAPEDLKALGKDGPDAAPETNMQTVTVGKNGPTPRSVETPDGVDPGFGYAPGRDAFESWLAPQAEEALDAGDAAAQWEPLTTTTARDLGLDPLPLEPAPVSLGPRIEDVDGVVKALTELLGGPSRVFDVHGLPLAISADVLGEHIAGDAGRTPYLPLLIDLIADPAEVWYSLERNGATDAVRARARLIKAYDLGKGRAVLFVANEVDGMLEGWTFFPSHDAAYIERQRQGLLWYAKEK